MPSPTTILVVLLLVLAAAFGGDRFGHARGVQQQKVADQVLFDKINKDIEEQKAIANMTYKRLSEQVIAKAQAADNFKHKLEVSREQRRKELADYRRSPAANGSLFFDAQVAGCGGGSGGTQSGGGQTPGLTITTKVEIPPALRGSIRAILDDADDLTVDYQACYDWANRP